MLKHLMSILAGIFFFHSAIAQTTKSERKIMLKNPVFKKVIREKKDEFFVYIDAETFIKDIDPDSIFDKKQYEDKKNLVKELTDYFASHDTLRIPFIGPRNQMYLFDKYVKGQFVSALAYGNATLYNTITRKNEVYVWSITNVTIEKKEEVYNGHVLVKERREQSGSLESADKKHSFWGIGSSSEKFGQK